MKPGSRPTWRRCGALVEEGERLAGAAPFGYWNISTCIAALRHDRIDAPWVFDGPVNGDILRTYIERVLVPTLSPGDVVVMDNLASS